MQDEIPQITLYPLSSLSLPQSNVCFFFFVSSGFERHGAACRHSASIRNSLKMSISGRIGPVITAYIFLLHQFHPLFMMFVPSWFTRLLFLVPGVLCHQYLMCSCYVSWFTDEARVCSAHMKTRFLFYSNKHMFVKYILPTRLKGQFTCSFRVRHVGLLSYYNETRWNFACGAQTEKKLLKKRETQH